MELNTQILPAIVECFFKKHPNLAMAKLARFEVFRASNDKGYVVMFSHIGDPVHGFSVAVMDEQIEEHKVNFGMGQVDENLYQVRHHGRTLTAKVGASWGYDRSRGPEDWELIDIYNEAGESVLKTYYEVNQGEIDALLEAVIDTGELVEL